MVKKLTPMSIKKSTQKKIGGIRTKELGKPSVITAVERASAKSKKKIALNNMNARNSLKAYRKK
jgi:hypothetical protein